MLRPSPALRCCLIWLAIALLPLRAWAALAMPTVAIGGAVAGVEVAASADAGPGASEATAPQSALPCHGALHGADSDHASLPSHHASGAEGGPEVEACSLCGVCHAAFALAPAALPAPPRLAPAAPVAVSASVAVTAVWSALERPPRATVRA